MTDPIEKWADDPNEYECHYCGGSASLRPHGGATMGVRCDSFDCPGYLPGATLQRAHDVSGVQFRPPPSKWTIGEPQPIRYVCPECGSDDVSRIPYDDGKGYYDVKVTCVDCDERVWE